MIKVVVFQLLVPERLEFVRTEAARDMYQGKKRGRVKKLP
jgi:hypothetical protein